MDDISSPSHQCTRLIIFRNGWAIKATRTWSKEDTFLSRDFEGGACKMADLD